MFVENGKQKKSFSLNRKLCGLSSLTSRVVRSKRIKKAKFGHKQFQKRPNPEK